MAKHPPDVVLLDVLIPGLDGFEVCRRLKREAATRLMPIILVTGLSARAERLEGLSAGADEFLTKPVDSQELLTRVRSLVRAKRYTDDLESASAFIIALAVMIDSRDGHTEGHCHRMANYATALGRALHLGSDDLQVLHRGGFLHDIGMLAIPDSLLRTPGRLTPDDYALIQSHTVIGDSLCSNLRAFQSVRPIVRHHHERLDGSGYPDGLKGDEIPLLAQIVSVVDAYDAMTTERSYQKVDAIESAVAVLNDEVERGWRRRELVDTFVDLVGKGMLSHCSCGGRCGDGDSVTV